MFSALKRWTKMGNDDSKLSMPTGVRAMGQALQRKFARGVQYNMKIVIKGDRNTGKTCMFQRLHGKPFSEQYIPTNEIQVGSIQWSYRATDDVVKVELWDVVDIGKNKKGGHESLKLENDANSEENSDTVLDAGFLDVYKGTHGVLMLLDITKPWTLQYVRRELPKVPPNIPVLVLANRRDMGEHRLVETEEVTSFIDSLERPDRSPPIHYAESSMKDGFGLKYIHTFLSFPFLLLQRETLLQQLQVNAVDMESNLEELQIHKESEEQDYDKFIAFLDRRKKERQAELEAKAAEVAAAVAAGDVNTPDAATLAAAGGTEKTGGKSAPVPATATNGESRGGLMKRWFSSSKPNVSSSEEVIPRQISSSSSATNIEEFTPGDELDAGFLDEKATARQKAKKSSQKSQTTKQVDIPETPSESSEEGDSDSNTGNPMVAGFAEDISSDEEDVSRAATTIPNGNIDYQSRVKTSRAKPVKPVMTEIALTSSEEEEEKEEEAVVVAPIPKVQSTSPAQTKPAPLKIVPQRSKQTKEDGAGPGDDVVDSWLNSPDLEPQIPFGQLTDYSVRKVDVHSPEPTVQSTSISMDDWEAFMSQQMTTSQKYASPMNPSASLLDVEGTREPSEETNINKKKEHKSAEKSRSKHKHRKHRDNEDSDDNKKERRRSKHKHGETKERKKSRDDESERQKKTSKHKHSKKPSTTEAVTYEEL